MCGIAGALNLGSNPSRVSLRAAVCAMADALKHRGPDDGGVWESPDRVVSLAHRRLSIIDLSPLGRNPMSWDNGRLWITFNGEIYNFHELRSELEGAGHRFRSQTDTEVILAAYAEWGLDAVERLAGMFGFALWDSAHHRLWLVRDRLGKKPIYYSTQNGVLAFASELKALVEDPSANRDIDRTALRLYLRYGYIPSPYSIYSSIQKLPPGHYLICEKGHVTLRRYWDAVQHATNPVSISDQEAEAHLEALLGTAVRQRRVADVPLGALLSGGVDSSLIVALMQEQSSTRVRTFTIRFDNPEFNEADHASAVASHLGTEHYEQTCDDRQMLAVVDRLPGMFDEPFADSSAIPTYMVSAIARRHVTVVLSGDGGDELFFGYPRYRYHSTADWALRLPRPLRLAAALAAAPLPSRRLRRIADVLRSDGNDRYARFISWWSASQIAALTGNTSAEGPMYADALARCGGLERDSRPGLLDLVSYLPEDILTKVDRASMAVSLEVRAPLLDHRVVEFALRLPTNLKFRGGSMKWILRRLLYKRVPKQLIERPKMGFGVPLGDWLRGPLRERMDSYCAGHDLEDLGLNPEPVREVWRAFLTGRAHRTDLIWHMFSLVAWSRHVRNAGRLAATR
jgi:asparagine synthase (glutamine-hydrolysing)